MRQGLFTVLLLTAATLAGCKKEPTYQGKAESEWITLTSDKDTETARRAWEAVASFTDTTAGDRLHDGLTNSDPQVRILCARNVEYMDPSGALGALQSVVKDEGARFADNPNFQMTLRLLGQQATPLRPQLQALLDKDPQSLDADGLRESLAIIPTATGTTQPTTSPLRRP